MPHDQFKTESKLTHWVNRHTLLAGLVGVFIGAAAVLVLTSARAQICKWVDENGVAHYAQTCPEGVEAERVEISKSPQPSAAASKKAIPYAGRDPDTNARSLSLEKLGSRLEKTKSRYLQTTSAMVRSDDSSLGGQFIIRLNASSRLKPGNVVEARFPDPAHPGEASFESILYEGFSPIIRIASRSARGFKCWNYHVVLSIFSDETKTTLLGTHEQLVQSRFDLTDVRNEKQFTEATSGGGNCPRSRRPKRISKPMSPRQLDDECERARERLLKPEREALIKRCISQENKDPEWCETYYRSYGDARRHGETMLPPRYWDIPECVEAREARKQNN
ncbi:MAG: hypothetical protein DRR42_26470 [Gammaproteobacteria bacterium]|nr:MAG: hypothetical protein DRR42_26470 [Gammaproteobacteria bacterium]